MQGILHRRRGVSALVAEIVLIAVLLIATVIFASFTFGLFSFYLSPAEVSVEGASCFAGGNSTTCQLTLTNVGSSDVWTTGSCTLSAGNDSSGSVVGGGDVPAGGSLSVQCVAHGINLNHGAQVAGTLPLTNGGTAFFTGTVQ